MAITIAMRTEVSQLYVALFGRAPDSEGLGFWVNLRNQGQTLTQIANAMYDTAPARPYYPTWLTNQEIIAHFYENVLGRTADSEGLAYWTGKLNAPGATPGSVITQLVDAVAHYTGTDAAGLESAALFNNKVMVAQYYAESGGTIEDATIVLAGVTADPGSATATIAAIDAGTIGVVPDTAQTFYLGVAQDVISGGSANDTFNAYVMQNSSGAQVNSLGSGDVLDGGNGTDTLMAKVTAGVFAGSSGGILGSQTMPIQPMTKSIEVVKIEAVNSGIGVAGTNIGPIDFLGLGLGETNVYINAKDMLGVDKIGSWNSDANLIIQNMTTLDNSGIARELSDMTVVMGYTGNRDSHWSESDLSVYFDQDYLNPSSTFTQASIDIRLMNEDAYDETVNTSNFRPLGGVYIAEMNFHLNGGYFGLDELIDENPSGDGSEIETYDELLAAVRAAIVALKAANPDNAALQTLQANFGPDFFSDISPTTGTQREGRSITLSVAGATNGVENILSVGPEDLQLLKAAAATLENSNRYERAEVTPPQEGQELSINVELEKVGNAGDGGNLLIGSMFKDGQNEWSDRYDGKGIDIFNVTVNGGDDKPSSLAGMHSTGDNLREVNVVTNAAQTGKFADLTIGNSNTMFLELPDSMRLGDVVDPTWRNQGALKDVQTFDAGGFKGDLTLYAALTNDVVDKYMDLTDTAAPAADNVQFTYTGGSGNDYINLWLSDYNLAQAGSTTREDFNLTINGGAGNDEIVTMIGWGSAGSGEDQSTSDNIVDSYWDNWYQNSAINANLHINGGDGNDTVRTLGSGNWVIDGGSGNDTIYADNTGVGEDGSHGFNNGKAAWVFNSVNNNVDDLLSENGASVSAVNAQLTVSFMGYSKMVAIANSVGSLTNVAITDLSINQAIKAAINDPTGVLSKLLVAEDGPAHTLVVRSLIDGYMDDAYVDPIDQLRVSFSTSALTPGQTNPGLVLFSTASAATPSLTDGYNPGADADFGHQYNGGWDVLRGGDSHNVADNQIQGGTGDDVIVLGTGEWSNDTLVYTGFANGRDSIVNFQDDLVGGYSYWTGSTPVAEVVTVTFTDSDGTPAGETILFDGDTITLSSPSAGVIPAQDVAFQFSEQFNSANWDVTYNVGDAYVTLTRTTAGAVADLTAGDFTGTYFTGGLGTATPLVTTQGQDSVETITGTAGSFTVDFDTAGTAALAAGTFTFDTVVTNYLAGDGSTSLADAIMANSAAYTTAGWTVARVDATSVSFTENVLTGQAIGTTGDFDLGSNGIVGTVAGVAGVATTTIPGVFVTVPPGPASDFDYIDFSAYDVSGVMVNDSNQTNDVVIGTAPVAGKYITMTEVAGASNDGVYTINLVTSTIAGTADDVVTLIGTADFGYEKDFSAETFII